MDRPDKQRKSLLELARRRGALTAIASGFVGALALATSTYNVYLQRQQVRAQVWPRLSLNTDLTNDTVTIEVQNRGVGPANIKRVRVWVDGVRANDWVTALSRLVHKSSFRIPTINEVEFQVMSPGLSIPALRVQGADAIELLRQRRRLGLELCYCSTLDDCWLATAADMSAPAVTTAIGECAPDKEPFQAVATKTFDELLEKLARDGGFGYATDAGPGAGAADGGR